MLRPCFLRLWESGGVVGKLVRGWILAIALSIGGPALAAPADGEWEGTLKHPDLPCSPCKVRLTVSGGLPNVRSSASIPSFVVNNDGSMSAEVVVRPAGNGVPMNCTLRGRAQSASMVASGTCGLYAVYAELDLKRLGAPPESAVAALPAPSPPPAPSPAPSPPPSSAPAPSPPPAASNFGAGTEPISMGALTYGIEPGAVIGRITVGNWLSGCGANGRNAPITHKPNTVPNQKIVTDEFERTMREAGYAPRPMTPTGGSTASYLVIGKVVSMDMLHCIRENTRPIQSSGTGTVRIEWTVVALQGGMSVYTTTTTGTHDLPSAERSSDGAREVFAGTYRDAMRKLAADPGFRNAVASAPSVNAARRSSEPTIAIRAQPRFANGITANMSRILPSVVEVRRSSGIGTGFVVDARGYFLTNAHVVGSADTVTLRFNDGSSQEAKVVRRDTLRDIALLKTEQAGLKPLPLRTGKLTLTEKVFAIGNPLGLSQTVTDGIVSAYRQRPNDGQEYIQASVSITFGNSGGPLLDANGNVVGVSVATMGGGLNFFIPIESALQHLDLKLVN